MLAFSGRLRSRRRKLRLFMDELQPTPETTVLDVGADELGFGEGSGCGTLNFFEEHYPWPERITALGLHAAEVCHVGDDAKDHEAMAHFLVAFDRLIRRQLKTKTRWDWTSQQTRTEESIITDPALGSYRRASSATRLVFPEPLAPTNATVFPAGTERSISRSAGTPR